MKKGKSLRAYLHLGLAAGLLLCGACSSDLEDDGERATTSKSKQLVKVWSAGLYTGESAQVETDGGTEKVTLTKVTETGVTVEFNLDGQKTTETIMQGQASTQSLLGLVYKFEKSGSTSVISAYLPPDEECEEQPTEKTLRVGDSFLAECGVEVVLKSSTGRGAEVEIDGETRIMEDQDEREEGDCKIKLIATMDGVAEFEITYADGSENATCYDAEVSLPPLVSSATFVVKFGSGRPTKRSFLINSYDYETDKTIKKELALEFLQSGVSSGSSASQLKVGKETKICETMTECSLGSGFSFLSSEGSSQTTDATITWQTP